MAVMPAEFVAGMRRLAASVTIVAAGQPGARAGLTATAVCSVSADPPQLLVCVNRSADAHDLIAATGSFTVNILADGQLNLADRFAGRGGHEGEAKFELGDWTTLATGAPILEGSCASFDCVVKGSLSTGTHTIYVGVVEAVRSDREITAILYHDGRYGRVSTID